MWTNRKIWVLFAYFSAVVLQFPLIHSWKTQSSPREFYQELKQLICKIQHSFSSWLRNAWYQYSGLFFCLLLVMRLSANILLRIIMLFKNLRKLKCNSQHTFMVCYNGRIRLMWKFQRLFGVFFLHKVCCHPLIYSIWVFVLIFTNDETTSSLQIGLDVKLELERINWIIYYPFIYSILPNHLLVKSLLVSISL